MIPLEYQIEHGVRIAIRAALQAASSTVPELATVRIIGFWLPPENDGETNDGEGVRVMLVAAPGSAEGYDPANGFPPHRRVQLDVACISQPDSDPKRTVTNALYAAVRGVFEAVPFAVDMGAGVATGAPTGILISNGGAGEIDDVGQVVSFSVEMHVCLT